MRENIVIVALPFFVYYSLCISLKLVDEFLKSNYQIERETFLFLNFFPLQNLTNE